MVQNLEAKNKPFFLSVKFREKTTTEIVFFVPISTRSYPAFPHLDEFKLNENTYALKTPCVVFIVLTGYTVILDLIPG